MPDPLRCNYDGPEDGFEYTAPIGSFDIFSSPYGICDLAGNVAEWVMDVYRPLSFEDLTDFRPFRGNVFKTNWCDKGPLPKPDLFGESPDESIAISRLNMDPFGVCSNSQLVLWSTLVEFSFKGDSTVRRVRLRLCR